MTYIFMGITVSLSFSPLNASVLLPIHDFTNKSTNRSGFIYLSVCSSS